MLVRGDYLFIMSEKEELRGTNIIKFILNSLALSEKRLDLLKVMVFPCVIIYISFYYFSSTIENIAIVIPDLSIIDKTFQVLNGFLN